MQLQQRHNAVSNRYLSHTSTNAFSQAEAAHLLAVKRLQIDKMKKENDAIEAGAVSVAPGTIVASKQNNEELEDIASTVATEAMGTAAAAQPRKSTSNPTASI